MASIAHHNNLKVDAVHWADRPVEHENDTMTSERIFKRLIGYDEIASRFRVCWVDDFHMSQALMFSEGTATENGFQVTGEYEVGCGQPTSSWRTEYHLEDDDQLTITVYNISPAGQAAKAVQTQYQRQQ